MSMILAFCPFDLRRTRWGEARPKVFDRLGRQRQTPRRPPQVGGATGERARWRGALRRAGRVPRHKSCSSPSIRPHRPGGSGLLPGLGRCARHRCSQRLLQVCTWTAEWMNAREPQQQGRCERMGEWKTSSENYFCRRVHEWGVSLSWAGEAGASLSLSSLSSPSPYSHVPLSYSCVLSDLVRDDTFVCILVKWFKLIREPDIINKP